MTEFPNKILFKSDDTEAILVEEIKSKNIKEPVAKYKYVKAKEFLGDEIVLGLKQITKLFESKLIYIK